MSPNNVKVMKILSDRVERQGFVSMMNLLYCKQVIILAFTFV